MVAGSPSCGSERCSTPDTSPASRATPATVAAFVRGAESPGRAADVAQRIIGLEQVCAPSHRRRTGHGCGRSHGGSRNAARPVRDKRSKLRPTDELMATGIRLMAEAEAAVGGSLSRRADLYRDGLMLALLALRPFRLTNFAGDPPGQHLRRVGTGWRSCFAAEHETKTKAAAGTAVPRGADGSLDRYLDHWRRVLLGKTQLATALDLLVAHANERALREIRLRQTTAAVLRLGNLAAPLPRTAWRPTSRDRGPRACCASRRPARPSHWPDDGSGLQSCRATAGRAVWHAASAAAAACCRAAPARENSHARRDLRPLLEPTRSARPRSRTRYGSAASWPSGRAGRSSRSTPTTRSAARRAAAGLSAAAGGCSSAARSTSWWPRRSTGFSRDQEDIAGLYKQLAFAGVRLVTVAEGEISELHVGLKGTMNALFLKDLAQKTQRGLRGPGRAGQVGRRPCYGYDVVPRARPPMACRCAASAASTRREAAIVRRIFTEFAGGQLAQGDRPAAERGRAFPARAARAGAPSTIRGNAARGTGILNNELYVGRLVWNRLRYIKDPETGKRVSRLNPMRPVDRRARCPSCGSSTTTLWEAVRRARAELTATRTRRQAKARVLGAAAAALSALGPVRCGVCGGGFAKVSAATTSAARPPATRAPAPTADHPARRARERRARCAAPPADGPGAVRGVRAPSSPRR